MPLSSKNKMINVKVSKNTYEFIKTFSEKYNCSVSSFCQDCITQAILFHDSESLKRDNPTDYYQQLAWFINSTYDYRRK